MAAQLTELRSRLLLPADAEALRRQWILRTEMAAAATWLERRPQLGIEMFGPGRSEVVRQDAGPVAKTVGPKTVGHDSDDELAESFETAADRAADMPVAGGDITDLLRACLVALHLPPHAETYQPRALPFWSISDDHSDYELIGLLEADSAQEVSRVG